MLVDSKSVQGIDRRHRLAFVEYQRRETEEIGGGVLPGARRQSGLVANFLQQRGAVPFFSVATCGRNKPSLVAGVNQHAVLPEANLLNVHHPP